MRIALTGATGLLGRNLLFEIFKQNLHRLDDLKIIVLGRSHKTASLYDRIKDIISTDGVYYIGVAEQNHSEFINKILNDCIIPIPFDLTKDGLDISADNFDKLKGAKIDYFFHVAALTDFRSDNTVKVKLEEVNVNGTHRVIDLVKKLNVGEIIYVGSAYSCGSKTGLVEPDYVNLNEKFRNPYEESKLKAEILVRDFAKSSGIKFKVFRPTTICGRLIEKPIGCTNKFDVFYAWAAFFLREKLKRVPFDKIYETPYNISVRIHFNSRSGLNIVPSDYAAKILYEAALNDPKRESCHLANDYETPHQLYVSIILESIKITGCTFVENEPDDKNMFEKFYYKTVGKIFTPYTLSESTYFNVNNLENLKQKKELSCPPVDKINLLKLLAYAKEKYFGIAIEESKEKKL